MDSWKDQLIRFYLERKALAVGKFELAGGGTSDFYIDGRLVTTYPPALRLVASAMSSVIKERKLLPPGANLVAPVLSGIPVATALGLELDIPFIMDRGKAKGHGHGKRFEGVFSESEHCLIVDDLITVGSSIVQTVGGLQELGKKVTDAVVIVDREEGGRENLLRYGIALHSLLMRTDLTTAWENRT
jgi:orotate phosphoribosyltransferase